ncbi:tripartite tricarboxylate transporter substrate binding protein [Roseomonas alkaliterrae]|uniref:Tripartite-type tricarboxylate transporter receptor subunit TctC n=1 Tax=Neoroseomonas alkaliterrae TaxID=1452450 RepID=A0A840XNX8_9PROT|nr:tripartite tricarboxylate transporter substrate binding protein [Neoroseomonas alkaliterrae]MBB5690288.1 tripartite-type tricarboxylate transporter receptor subunit TctC [Neoroseomonas alkaliterrae]MBR0676178.1 tripartite tricarboxylate transporter substrate binding protein [Neoroseomonas alkaliterrae]
MRRLLLAAVAASLLAFPAAAQERTIRIISGFAPGGAGDLMARLIAEYVPPLMGARGVVENRTGANGLIGAEVVARSAPDGNTVLQCPMGSMTITPNLPGAALPIDPRTELTGVANVALSTYALVVAARGPHQDVPGLLAAARARPGGLTYASAGVGSAQHLSAELLKARTGLDIVHVPYRGAALAVVDILGGRTDFMITNLGDVMRQVTGGELRILAMGDDAGSPLFPQVRPISAFVPGLQMAGWFGICGPRAMSEESLARWSDATRRALENPQFRERLLANGLTPNFEDTRSFNARIARDLASWGEVIRTAGVRGD